MYLTMLLAMLMWQQAEEPKPPVLEGKVVERGTGAPVAKASVTLVRTGSSEMNPPKVDTDAEGKFKFEDLKAGTYLVLAEKTGYSRVAYGAKNDGALRGIPIRLGMNERRTIDIAIVKQGLVTGKVTDAEGEALQGVVVFGLRPTYQRGRKTWLPVGVGQMPAMTSDTGEYRLTGLPAGQFRICAMPMSVITGAGMTAPDARKGPSGKPESNVVTCYPDEPEVERASVVEVNDGSEIPGIQIRLAQRPVVTVKGQVTGLPANVPQMLALSLSRPGQGVAGMMFSNRAVSSGGDGKFEFRNVLPGKYVLHTLPMPTGAISMGVKMALEVTEDVVQEVAPAALLPFEVEGRVVVEGEAEPRPLPGVRLILSADDDVYQSVPMGNVREGGVFKVAGVTADRYEVTVQGLPEGLYLKSMEYASRSWKEGVVELRDGSQPLTLVLGADAATVAGQVVNEKGEAAPGAYVVLVDRQHRARHSYTARADEKGAFRMLGVQPGEYRLFAADEVEPGGVDSAEYLKPWLAKAEALSVAAKQRPAVTVRLQ